MENKKDIINSLTNIENKLNEIKSNYKIYQDLSKEELKYCLLVERQHVGAFKYSKILNEFIKYCNEYINNNKPTSLAVLQDNKTNIEYDCEIFDINVPEILTKKINFIKNLDLNFKIYNVIGKDFVLNNSEFGDGGATHGNNDKIVKVGDEYKLYNTKINVNAYAVNGRIYNKTILTILYHEFNHVYDNFKRLLKYNNPLDGLYYNLVNKNYDEKLNLRINAKNEYDFAMGTILYRLWNNTERNALVTSVYAYLESIDSDRKNFTYDFKNSQGYYIYNILKNEYIPKINSLNNEELWLKYINLISPDYKGSVIKYKKSFIKRCNILLSSLFKKMTSAGLLYYDKKDGITDKEETIIV